MSALGVVVVAPPWNFPYAIPAGGVLAALMAGNTVLLKPSSETKAIAWRLARQLWEAGIPRDVLRFFPRDQSASGRALITDPRVAAVVLTGACQTARMFLDWRPSLRLFAETSGKNSIIISAQSDRDLAVKDLVKSAFGHSGQKCSAASLAILEAEVYDDPAFRAQLLDAAASLPVGAATNPASVVTPLIHPPGEDLRRALTTLDPGEQWLLRPGQIGDDPCLWSPGVKLGVRPGSWFHRTECFGPVLGLIRAENLDHAIAIQNDSDFGLTAGIALARRRGNRPLARARRGGQPLRQPRHHRRHRATPALRRLETFQFRAGRKGGRPQLRRPIRPLRGDRRARRHLRPLVARLFLPRAGPVRSALRGQCFPLSPLLAASFCDWTRATKPALALAQKAAQTCGTRLHVSLAGKESEESLAARLPALAAKAEFLRTVKPPSDVLLRAAYAAGFNWIDAPILSDGRFELPRWLREQSLSQTRHRYGLLVSDS